MLKTAPTSSLPHGLRNADYPATHIAKIQVSLDGPDHLVTLEWEGPHAQEGETGPFRSSPGAGILGHNCDDPAASQHSGSKCTPKGTFLVEGFEAHLNDDPRAVHVTWFKRDRDIGLHFFPEVPPLRGFARLRAPAIRPRRQVDLRQRRRRCHAGHRRGHLDQAASPVAILIPDHTQLVLKSL